LPYLSQSGIYKKKFLPYLPQSSIYEKKFLPCLSQRGIYEKKFFLNGFSGVFTELSNRLNLVFETFKQCYPVVSARLFLVPNTTNKEVGNLVRKNLEDRS
jgi:hypothetical protein